MEKDKKPKLTEETETLFEDAACANECTGLMQGMPIDEADKESYGKIFDYGIEAGLDEVHAGDVRMPNEKRGSARGASAGKPVNKNK